MNSKELNDSLREIRCVNLIDSLCELVKAQTLAISGRGNEDDSPDLMRCRKECVKQLISFLEEEGV